MRFTHNGKTMTLREWSELTGIPAQTLRCRIYDLKWDVRIALTRSPKDRRGIPNHAKLDQKKADNIRLLLKQGFSQKDVAEYFGVSTSTVRNTNKGLHWVRKTKK